MSWYALDAVDDATDVTRSFLFPFDLGRWLRLAVIAFFVGGGLNAFNWLRQVPVNPDLPAPSTAASTALALAAAGLALVVVLAFAVAGPVMRFVLLDALRTDEVVVRRRFRERFWDGVRLLVFLVGAFVLVVTVGATLAVMIITGGGALLEQAGGGLSTGLAVVAALVGVLLALLAVVALTAFFHFSTAFVPPTMVATDSGVLAAWGRVWRVLRGQRWQFVLYVLARVLLGVATGILSYIVTLLGAVVIGLVGLAAGLVVAVAFGGVEAAVNSTAGLVALGVVVLVAVLCYLLTVALPLRITVLTFFTSYELSVLGSADPELDILADFDEQDSEGGDPGAGDGDADGGTGGAGPGENGGDDADVGTGDFEFGRVDDDGDATDGR